MEAHDRFEQLALTHVLGGIGRDDADAFRSHLRVCADCRARVAELRGISSTLDAAAREERRRVASGEVPVRRDHAPVDRQTRGPGSLSIVLIALALVAGFAFWNLHLRTSVDAYLSAAEDRGAILRDLAAGELVEDPSMAAVSARIAVTGSRVALVIADGGPLASDERLVAWLAPLGSSTDEAVVLAVGPTIATEVAVRIQRGTATQLIVTRERGLLSSSGPRGAEVLRAALP